MKSAATTPTIEEHRRILIVDDQPSVHHDFAAILQSSSNDDTAQLDSLAASFGYEPPDTLPLPTFELDFAIQGSEARVKVQSAVAQHRPYSIAFVDIFMPPGWDGVTTARQLVQIDPRMQVVIFTGREEIAYDDLKSIGNLEHNLFILRKPVDPIIVRQMAIALSERWKLAKQASLQLAGAQRERAIVSRMHDNLPLGMLHIDHRGRPSYLNATARRLLGLPQAVAEDASFDPLRHLSPDDALLLRVPGTHLITVGSDGNAQQIYASVQADESRSDGTTSWQVVLRPTEERDEAQQRHVAALERVQKTATAISHELNRITQGLSEVAPLIVGMQRVEAAAERGDGFEAAIEDLRQSARTCRTQDSVQKLTQATQECHDYVTALLQELAQEKPDQRKLPPRSKAA